MTTADRGGHCIGVADALNHTSAGSPSVCECPSRQDLVPIPRTLSIAVHPANLPDKIRLYQEIGIEEPDISGSSNFSGGSNNLNHQRPTPEYPTISAAPHSKIPKLISIQH